MINERESFLTASYWLALHRNIPCRLIHHDYIAMTTAPTHLRVTLERVTPNLYDKALPEAIQSKRWTRRTTHTLPYPIRWVPWH